MLEESHWGMQKLNVLFRGLERDSFSTQKFLFFFDVYFKLKSGSQIIQILE